LTSGGAARFGSGRSPPPTSRPGAGNNPTSAPSGGGSGGFSTDGRSASAATAAATVAAVCAARRQLTLMPFTPLTSPGRPIMPRYSPPPSMATENYELILMLDPQAEDDAREKVAADAKSKLEGKGEIKHEANWGMRKMAYEIDKRGEADYRFYRFTGPIELLDELNHSLRITDGVLRFRIFTVDEDSPTTTPPDTEQIMRRDEEDRGRGRGRDRDDRGPRRPRYEDSEPAAAAPADAPAEVAEPTAEAPAEPASEAAEPAPAEPATEPAPEPIAAADEPSA